MSSVWIVAAVWGGLAVALAAVTGRAILFADRRERRGERTFVVAGNPLEELVPLASDARATTDLIPPARRPDGSP